jgi:hypothetical protein
VVTFLIMMVTLPLLSFQFQQLKLVTEIRKTKTGGTDFLVQCTEYCKSLLFYLFRDDQNKDSKREMLAN